MSEFGDRVAHFYLQTDGTIKWPSSAEGDLLKIAHKEIKAQQEVLNAVRLLPAHFRIQLGLSKEAEKRVDWCADRVEEALVLTTDEDESSS